MFDNVEIQLQGMPEQVAAIAIALQEMLDVCDETEENIVSNLEEGQMVKRLLRVREKPMPELTIDPLKQYTYQSGLSVSH